MRLSEVQEGQTFILLRNGKQYTHHGRHPKFRYRVLTQPYRQNALGFHSLHLACAVELVEGESAGLSDKVVGHGKHSCQNRPRSALSSPVIVRDGYKGDGLPKFRTIPTQWKDKDSGACQYARTDEGKADPGCEGCIWRHKA
jgi:hypothetical protein